MGEANGGRHCPDCGAIVDSQFCPHCGARIGAERGPDRGFETGSTRAAGTGNEASSGTETSASTETSGTKPPPGPLWSGHRDSSGPEDAQTVPSLPIVPRFDGPLLASPEMFPTEMVPTTPAAAGQAWSQTPEALGPHPPVAQTGLFPGWTGMYPAVATEGAPGALAPRPERRRKAIYAVLGIAAVTVLVLVTALLIAPRWGATGTVADKDGRPTSVNSTAPISSTANSTRPSITAPTTAALPAPGRPTPARTVTVTATPTPTPTSTPSSTSKPTTAAASTTQAPLGVPQRDIVCNPGYIVQLASEFDAGTFAAHIARLKSVGQIPAGSLAADSTRSCQIFTSQTNTLVLYAGPFSSKYAGCAARLAGPADAFIKGSNADNAQEYVSCLCPATVAGLPRVTKVGQQAVWVGELQRVIGNRLNISIGDLSGNWGTFTAGTKAAVKKFQQAAKLPANGVVDARTWKALQSAEC